MSNPPSGEQRETFQMPPVLRNDRGEVRRAGLEFEFSGLSIEQSAQLVAEAFDGEVVFQTTFAQRVVTSLGHFQVEIDTRFLTDKEYERPLRSLGLEPDKLDTRWLQNALLGTLSTWFPIEVGCPPVPINELGPLDGLRHRLQRAGAKGTRASLLNAFGLHINAEVPDLRPQTLLAFLRAYVLLYPWLKERSEVYLTRAIAPYIKHFPPEYNRLILAEDYPADAAGMIDDYLAHNATRHRGFDMLPVLAYLDRDRVTAAVGADHKVKPRPSFHYRLPNCLVDEPDWRLATEWNTWVAVERLAHHPDTIAAMSSDYRAADEASFRPFRDKWPDVLESYVGSPRT